MTAERQILVTGATGCVGRAVASAARRRGWRVRGLARQAGHGAGLDGVVLLAGDVRDAAKVRLAIAGCDAVVHLAGWVHRRPRGDRELAELRSSIVEGTRVVASAAAFARTRLVMTSSIAVFGPRRTDDGPPAPDTPYGRAKLEAEGVARDACHATAILRPALVFGPNDRGNIARLIRLVDRRMAFVVGDGSNRKSMVHVDNLADRIIASLEQELTGTWVAADDPAPTQAELVRAISQALGRRSPPTVPRWPMQAVASAFDLVGRSHWRDRVDRLAQSTEFHGFALDQALGYAPRVVWADGIRTQVEQWKSA